MDLAMTLDNEVVLMHDDYVDRTTQEYPPSDCEH